MSRSSTPEDTGNASARSPALRQTLSWLHTWAGLTFGWLLLFMFLTGTAGYFDTEIDRWMQPELPRAAVGGPAADSLPRMLDALEQRAASAERWTLNLPADRNQPYPEVIWRGANSATEQNGQLLLHPATGEPLSARATGGGQQLYQMHWLLHYTTRTYSDWLVIAATLFMFVALLTGVIIHKRIFKDFFIFRRAKGQRSWLDAHNVLSVTTLPFQLMITYSGLLFMGFAYMPLIVAAHYGSDAGDRSRFFDEVFSPPGLVEPAGTPAPLTDIMQTVEQAEQQWGTGRVSQVTVHHPGDRNARIVIAETVDRTIAATARRLVFDGTSGRLLHQVAGAPSAAKAVRDSFLGLHEARFATPLLRWLCFFLGLLGSGMVASGLILWCVKRRQRAERQHHQPPRGVHFVERLNIGAVVGLPVAMAAYFLGNRLLPLELTERAQWEVHLLFLTWLAMLVHGTLRPRHRAWVEQCQLAGVTFLAVPLANALTTERHLLHSLGTGDWVFAGFDLTMLALAAAFLWSSRRIAHGPRPASRVQPALNTTHTGAIS